MDLVVDHARQHKSAGRIYHLDAIGGADAGRDLADPITLDEDIGVTNHTFIDQARIGNQ